jgi:hypothetical protein
MNEQISEWEKGIFLPIGINIKENRGTELNVVFYNSGDTVGKYNTYILYSDLYEGRR